MLKQLIWKQWKEQGWRIVFATVILGGYTAIGLNARITQDEFVILIAAVIGAFLLPVFITMGLVAPQRADRSYDRLVAMPVERSTLLAVTALTGAVGCIMPLACSYFVAHAIAGEREMPAESMNLIYGVFTVLAVVLMLWTLFVSIRQRSEARVGLTGVLLLLAATATAMLMGLVQPLGPLHGDWWWTIHPLALGTAIDHGWQLHHLVTLAVQAALIAVLARWATRRLL